MTITQKYDLNLIPYASPVPKVHVSQYDRGSRTLAFTLYNGEDLYTIPERTVATIQGLKGDDNAFEYEMTVSGANEVSVNIEEQMAAVAGEVICEIVLAKNGDILGSANFLLVVEPSPMDEDAVTSATDIPALNVLIDGAEEDGQILSWNGTGVEWTDPSTGGFIHVATTAEWDAQPELIARADHIYFYSDYKLIEGSNVPAAKIGDGNSLLADLPFVSGNEDAIRAILGSLAYKNNASGTFTPAGTVSTPAFTGTEGNVEADYTPAGTVSAPTVTVTPTTDTVNSITAVGTLPELSMSVENETLHISFNKGTLPTKGANQTVMTGASASASVPTFTGTAGKATGKFTPEGTVSQPTFTGTAGTVTVE